MIPEPHVCCVCRREVVWTDCLPAVCWRCSSRKKDDLEEKRIREQADKPTIVTTDLPRESTAG